MLGSAPSAYKHTTQANSANDKLLLTAADVNSCCMFAVNSCFSCTAQLGSHSKAQHATILTHERKGRIPIDHAYDQPNAVQVSHPMRNKSATFTHGMLACACKCYASTCSSASLLSICSLDSVPSCRHHETGCCQHACTDQH